MEFEWDEAKASANFVKHGVDFVDAIRVFEDLWAVQSVDRPMDYGEERFLIVGMVDGTILTIVYTERGDRIRIISARKAVKNEQKAYDGSRQGRW